ncbi:hypothetical protein MTR_0160s0090 [Medicago truncatula]|uniref:Uncharacterized protein n=1 Tax=Medicago truncatula TaxID=3880 RepID=A0A072TSI1_MEDTR|nr:hypothetical protein MTR_0160s0090 [Medicago truncatula]
MASRNIETLLSYHSFTVCLPKMFGGDFGDQIGCYAILTNPKSNKFEVLVNKVNGAFFSQRDGKRFLTFTQSVLVPRLPWFLWVIDSLIYG